MMKLNKVQQELLVMLDDLFEYESEEEAYLHLIRTLYHIKVEKLKYQVKELIGKAEKNDLSKFNMN